MAAVRIGKKKGRKHIADSAAAGPRPVFPRKERRPRAVAWLPLASSVVSAAGSAAGRACSVRTATARLLPGARCGEVSPICQHPKPATGEKDTQSLARGSFRLPLAAARAADSRARPLAPSVRLRPPSAPSHPPSRRLRPAAPGPAAPVRPDPLRRAALCLTYSHTRILVKL